MNTLAKFVVEMLVFSMLVSLSFSGFMYGISGFGIESLTVEQVFFIGALFTLISYFVAAAIVELAFSKTSKDSKEEE